MSDTYSRVADILKGFPVAVSELTQQYSNEPLINSQRARELGNCAGSQHIKAAYNRAQSLIFHVAADHTDAAGRALTSPLLTYSPWASARCVLEACSLAYWLAHTDVDYKERMSRMLNVRLKSIKDGLSYMRAVKASAEHIDEQEYRIEHLRRAARQFDVPEKCSKKGKFLGFGNGLPPYADLADIAFNAGDLYRLLSGATHSEFWTHPLSLEVKEGPKSNMKMIRPDIEERHALWLGMLIIEWFSKAAWMLFKLFGWDMKKLAATLEGWYDQICAILKDGGYDQKDFKSEARFWRKDYLAMVRPMRV